MSVPYVPPGMPFPSLEEAQGESGLLAWGADLSVSTLLSAYTQSIFPWFDQEPILWWTPDPRTVIVPEEYHMSTAVRRVRRHSVYRVTQNRCFEAVIRACACLSRPGQSGTWITEEMITAYLRLHEAGWAHSWEVWSGRLLVGGLYGVGIGAFFAGESMFAIRDHASRVAIHQLVEEMRAVPQALIDCQFSTPHLSRLGASCISRTDYCRRLAEAIVVPAPFSAWQAA